LDRFKDSLAVNVAGDEQPVYNPTRCCCSQRRNGSEIGVCPRGEIGKGFDEIVAIVL